jgi:hypothetical protein
MLLRRFACYSVLLFAATISVSRASTVAEIDPLLASFFVPTDQLRHERLLAAILSNYSIRIPHEALTVAEPAGSSGRMQIAGLLIEKVQHVRGKFRESDGRITGLFQIKIELSGRDFSQLEKRCRNVLGTPSNVHLEYRSQDRYLTWVAQGEVVPQGRLVPAPALSGIDARLRDVSLRIRANSSGASTTGELSLILLAD